MRLKRRQVLPFAVWDARVAVAAKAGCTTRQDVPITSRACGAAPRLTGLTIQMYWPCILGVRAMPDGSLTVASPVRDVSILDAGCCGDRTFSCEAAGPRCIDAVVSVSFSFLLSLSLSLLSCLLRDSTSLVPRRSKPLSCVLRADGPADGLSPFPRVLPAGVRARSLFFMKKADTEVSALLLN